MAWSVRAQTAAAPETLADAWRIALAVNRPIRATRELTESARHSLDAAREARLPTLALGGGYTILSHPPTTIVDIPTIIVPGFATPLRLSSFDLLPVGQARSWTYRATASMPLYTSGRIDEGISAAGAGVDAARAGEAATALDIRLRVAESYVAVLRTTRLQAVVESEIKGLEAHAADAENLFEEGLTAKNDVLAAQVALADARQRGIQATNATDSARAAYNRLLDRPLDHAAALEDPSVTVVDGDLSALTERALARRPEIAALSADADAQTHRAAGLVAATRPQASAGGGYSYQQNRYQLYPGFWSLGLDVQWTVFDGVSRAEAAAARGQADAAVTRRDELRSIVALEVRQAWLEADTARQRLEVAQQATAQADENLRVARDRYSAGVGIATEVLDAETLRTRSYVNAASASYDRLLALLRLHRAIGDL